ncbi:MAG: histidinol-phosphate transaminase [Deferribacteraceae bacterium]|jgi:histidinol-phosphate aminotransferase|nr:histidinol-phosphate transaminase [Deferribacteraceae bacterium]
MTDYSKLAGGNIGSLVPYKPGKPIEELKREFGLERVIKLASNENPLGPSPKVTGALIETLPEISRYPDGDAYMLRQAVSKKLNVPPDQLLFGAGSNEIIELLLRTFVKPGEYTVSPSPSFSVYSIISQAMGTRCEWAPTSPTFETDLDRLIAAVKPGVRVVFLASPNNPTGRYINSNDLKTFMQKVPGDTIIAMDEAYCEFTDAPDYPETLGWYKEYPNMVLMRTFSKAYGLAGLRIGYCIADKMCCEMMNRVRQPFNTNMLAQIAAAIAINDEEWLKNVLRNNTEGKKYLYEEFEKLGIKYIPTQANFILADVGDGMAVFEKLLQKGVIVRFMGKELPSYIRVSIGTPEENKIFLKALKEIIVG